MASFFNLTLDTKAPAGVTLQINNNAEYTTTKAVTLTIGCSDENKSGYQMKVWGIENVEDEQTAQWENYAESKSVNLTDGNGLKTVHIKIRDDVFNESEEVSDTITLDTSVPTVTISGPDVSKVSKISGKNVSSFTFMSDVKIVEWKIMVVESSTALHDAGTNKAIPNTSGSTNMTGSSETNADTAISCTIYGADLESASNGDGVKIVKVFVKNEAGTWSIA